MDSLLKNVTEAADLISTGGQKAIVYILVINLVSLVVFCYFVAKFLLTFIKNSNESKDKALAEKDKVIESRTSRLETIAENQNKAAMLNIEKDNQIISSISEIRNLMLFSNRQEK